MQSVKYRIDLVTALRDSSLNYLLLSIAIERIEIPLHDPSMINQKRVVRSISSLDPLWNPNLEVID